MQRAGGHCNAPWPGSMLSNADSAAFPYAA